MATEKMSKCRNCNASMTIKSSDQGYKFVLTHPKTPTCPGEFKLETHQNTIKQCVAKWNKFNKESI